MKILIFFFGLWILILCGTGMIFAEWVDGEVKKIDAKDRTLTIGEIDPITDTEENQEIAIDSTTVFSGVKSLEELQEGDDISAEVQYDAPTDSWKAISIEIPEAGD